MKRTFFSVVLVVMTFSAISPLKAQTPQAQDDLITTIQAQLDAEIGADASVPGQLFSVIAPSLNLDWDAASGVVDFTSQEPLLPDDTFRIASVTKTFVAAAVLRLVEMGDIDLDASIEDYVSADSIAMLKKDAYATDQITVAQLLTHTSGIADYSASNPVYIQTNLDNPSQVWTRLEQIAFAVENAEPVGAPGTKFSYSDTGYVLLGELIERQTGQNLGSAVRELLDYDRLGLTSTYWERFEEAPQGLRQAHQYFGELDITAGMDPSIDLYGGGGLVSTTHDLAVFFRALLMDDVFEKSTTLQTMLTIPNTNYAVEQTTDAAMGIFRISGGGLTCWTHSGFWGVFVIVCPDIDVTVARSINQVQQRTISALSLVNPILLHALDK